MTERYKLMEAGLDYFKPTFTFIKEKIIAITVISFIVGVLGLFHYLAWWEAIGLLILKFGLGVKVGGAKTFAIAVAKSGGKKALLLTTTGVLLKRHIIDVTTKFFAEHSISRYKSNIFWVLKIWAKDLKNSPPMRKVKYVLGTLGSVPFVYALWAKVASAGVQKIIYAVAVFIWGIISTSFNYLSGIISFILQVTFLNYFLKWLEGFKIGKLIIKFMFETIKILGQALDLLNDSLKWVGFDPKHYLIVYSIKFNRYLEKIIMRESNAYETIQRQRKTHCTSRELLLLKRAVHKEGKKKNISFAKKTKDLFNKKVLKQTTWQERREQRKLSKLKVKV